jgi:hypothetical protein
VILPLVLAAATAAAPLTFEGIAMGDDATKIAAAHAGHSTFTALGPAWTWRREGGGTMLVASDLKGKVTVVDFSADQGEDGSVSLPLAGPFGIQDTHGNLASAVGGATSECQPNYSGGFCGVYSLAGGTAIVAQFENNDGQLHRATWATPATLTKLLVLPPAISPTT